MKQVQKFPLTFIDTPQAVTMPASAPLLRAHLMGDTPHVWALVDTDAATVARYFSVIADGKAVPDYGVDAQGNALPPQYLGSLEYQEFSWHIFETASP